MAMRYSTRSLERAREPRRHSPGRGVEGARQRGVVHAHHLVGQDHVAIRPREACERGRDGRSLLALEGRLVRPSPRAEVHEPVGVPPQPVLTARQGRHEVADDHYPVGYQGTVVELGASLEQAGERLLHEVVDGVRVTHSRADHSAHHRADLEKEIPLVLGRAEGHAFASPGWPAGPTRGC
jgi:hypothetical protein